MLRAFTVVCVIGTLLAGCKTGPQKLEPASLPPNPGIVTPGADVPAESAAFSGVWAGTWGSDLDGKLAVQTIQPDGKVRAIYAWGDHSGGRFTAGSTEASGQINDGTLTLDTFGNGANVSYLSLIHI